MKGRQRAKPFASVLVLAMWLAVPDAMRASWGQDLSGLKAYSQSQKPFAAPEFLNSPADDADSKAVDPFPCNVGSGGDRMLLNELRISGNALVPASEFAAVKACYQGQYVSTEDLARARDTITDIYISKYRMISSGAVLAPVQPDLPRGVVDIQIIEGRVGEVRIDRTDQAGLDRVSDSYVLDRFGVQPGDPVVLSVFEDRFRRLLDDPALKQINAELLPGATQGEAVVAIKAKQAAPFRIQFEVANDRSPSVGGERGSVELLARNAFVSGDVFVIEAGRTAGALDGRISYAMPLTASGLNLEFDLDASKSELVEEPVNELDILSESVSSSLKLAFPVLRENTPEMSLNLRVSGGLNFEFGKTSLGGAPFSFSPGANNGRTEYWSSVLGAELTDRRPDSVFAMSLGVEYGLKANLPLVTGVNTPAEDFFLVTAQAQYVRKLDDDGLSLILRASGQWADEPLFVSDKFSAGGLGSVRGYRRNAALGDFGVAGTVEIDWPAVETGLGQPGRKDLRLFVFSDVAHLWDNDANGVEQARLWGAGGGIEWTPEDYVTLRLTYGEAIDRVDLTAKETLQDKGVYFQLTLRPE